MSRHPSGRDHAGARRSHSPACGFPARLRSSTHDFACRATRDGRRDLRAPAWSRPLRWPAAARNVSAERVFRHGRIAAVGAVRAARGG